MFTVRLLILESGEPGYSLRPLERSCLDVPLAWLLQAVVSQGLLPHVCPRECHLQEAFTAHHNSADTESSHITPLGLICAWFPFSSLKKLSLLA